MSIEIQFSEVKIACQHLEFLRKDYQLRCTLAMLTFGEGAATPGL